MTSKFNPSSGERRERDARGCHAGRPPTSLSAAGPARAAIHTRSLPPPLSKVSDVFKRDRRFLSLYFLRRATAARPRAAPRQIPEGKVRNSEGNAQFVPLRLLPVPLSSLPPTDSFLASSHQPTPEEATVSPTPLRATAALAKRGASHPICEHSRRGSREAPSHAVGLREGIRRRRRGEI